MTIRNSYPLPLISDLLDRVKGAKVFTKLDIKLPLEQDMVTMNT